MTLFRRAGFLERTLAHFALALERADTARRLAAAPGMLQRLDPRSKLAGALLLILAATIAHQPAITLGFGLCATALALISGLPLGLLARRIWLPVFLFSGTVAVPALFTTPGSAIGQLPLLSWTITAAGLQTAIRLLARAETCATLAVVVVMTTPWNHLLKALRMLRVPGLAVAILGMTHRYIFLLLGIASETLEARRSRTVGRLSGAAQRQQAGATLGALLGKSLQLADEVHDAMRARGFRGASLTLEQFRFRALDAWAAAAALLLSAAGLLLDHRL